MLYVLSVFLSLTLCRAGILYSYQIDSYQFTIMMSLVDMINVCMNHINQCHSESYRHDSHRQRRLFYYYVLTYFLVVCIHINKLGLGGKADILKADLKKILESGKADFFWPRNVKADFAKADFLQGTIFFIQKVVTNLMSCKKSYRTINTAIT